MVAPLEALKKEVDDAVAEKNFAKALGAIDAARDKINPQFKPIVQVLKFMTLSKYDVPSALVYAATLKAEAPSLMPTLALNIVSEENLPKEAYQFALDQFRELLSKPGMPVPLVHHYMAMCYSKMGDFSNAVACEKAAIASAEEALSSGKYPTLVSANTLQDYKESLDRYMGRQ